MAKNAISQFEQELNRYENGPLDKLQGVQKRLMEYQHTVEFESLSIGEQDRIQELIVEAKDRENVLMVNKAKDAKSSGKQASKPRSSFKAIESGSVSGATSHEHDPQAEKFMEDAEGLFYSGRYADAISQYEKVLQIEPEWGRAKEHQGEAEEYLKKGTIPMEALPQEVGILYGKAQSAARYGDYGRAKEMLNSAKRVLAEHKIMKWQEGANFEVQLDNNIAALDVAREADKLFRQGKFDEAIGKLETVASVTGNPTYKEKARNYQEFKEQSRTLFGRLGGKPTLDLVIEVAREIEALEQEYGESQTLERLQTRLNDIKPSVGESLRIEINALKGQAERAQTIADAKSLANQAKGRIEEAVALQIRDFSLTQMSRDISNLITKLENYENELQRAQASYRNNRRWPSDAWEMSTDVRANYPTDPNVSELTKSLLNYRLVTSGLWGISALVVLVFLIVAGVWGSQQVKAYMLSQITPTATLTLTPIPTLTSTLPPTLTPTLPPTATLPPSPTATPIFGHVIRDVYARNGCYDNFTAVGPIPAGSRVDILPSPDRRFDNLNRECILIEYKTDKYSYIGWILLKDFSQ